MSLHVSDGERMKLLAGCETLTQERALTLLSNWWQLPIHKSRPWLGLNELRALFRVGEG